MIFDRRNGHQEEATAGTDDGGGSAPDRQKPPKSKKPGNGKRWFRFGAEFESQGIGRPEVIGLGVGLIILLIELIRTIF